MKDDQAKPVMNPLGPEDQGAGAALQKVAVQTNIDPLFQAELEKRLKAAYRSKGTRSMPSLRKLAPVLAWILALIVLAFAVDWVIRSLVSPPRLATGDTPTPAISPMGVTATQAESQPTPTPSGPGYDWNGTTLFLRASLPDSPGEANAYLLQPDLHATPEEAIALAGRFGIQAELYRAPGELPGTTDYVITDGRQRLIVRSERYFTYYADYPKSLEQAGIGINAPDASARIDTFLKDHGFDFEYRLEPTDMWGRYYVTPLTPDGYAVHHEDLRPSGLMFTLDGSGQVASVQANLVSYRPVRTFGIRTAEEAWKSLLDNNSQAGRLEWMYSPSGPTRTWQRTYPLGQAITIYGYASSFAAVDAGQPPLIQIDGYTVSGDTGGMDRLPQNTFVEASGSFSVENGIRKFALTSWKVSESSKDGLLGTLQRTNGQVVLSAQEGNFLLPDVPADLPLPFENAFVTGVRLGDRLEWTSIDDRSLRGGGGGGGGEGFYKVNLSGTPVPLPSPLPIILPPEQKPVGQQIEGQRGLLNVTYYKQTDGMRTVYTLISKNGTGEFPYLVLEGDLQALLPYNNRPVDIWGRVGSYDQYGSPVVKVERYEIPFPDLEIGILKGTQNIVQLEGQPVTLFTAEDGKSFVQEMPNGDPDQSQVGKPGDPVLVEALAIPEETYAGYPALRVFSSQMAINPKTGQPTELTITANQPFVTTGPVETVSSSPPTAAIEKVELVYFVSDPRYAADPNAGYPYLQPAWRFYGHYSNGEEFEVLIQAFKDEYLLPELAPFTPPG
jgi:hypothetical protein